MEKFEKYIKLLTELTKKTNNKNFIKYIDLFIKDYLTPEHTNNESFLHQMFKKHLLAILSDNEFFFVIKTNEKISKEIFKINDLESTIKFLNLCDLNCVKGKYEINLHIYNPYFNFSFSSIHNEYRYGLNLLADLKVYIHLETISSNLDLFDLHKDPKSRIYTIFKFIDLINNDSLENKLIYLPSDNFTSKNIPFKDSKFHKVIPDLLTFNTKYGTTSPTNLILENKNYTFGLEIETCLGKLTNSDYDDLNVSCIYDGSLKDEDGIARGGEYVTGVLVGDAGINQLHKIVNKLVEKNCRVNNKCSVHVHIGNCNFNKENLLSMYLLGIMLEKEMYSLFPKSRLHSPYCKLLYQIFDKKELEDLATLDHMNFEYYNNYINYLFDLKLYPYVRDGVLKHRQPLNLLENEHILKGIMPSKVYNKYTAHPQGNKCGYDKNAQRYSWLNFVTCLFNNRGFEAKTLEFRIHNGTLNFKKILAWLKICVAFTWFAENHKKHIFKGYYTNSLEEKEQITLSLILRLCYPKTYKLLLKYVEERKNLFSKNPKDDMLNEKLEYEESLNLVTSFKLKELLDTI